ncbi:MAG: DUF4337 family protein [Acidobacteriaceae bacterium]
MSEDFDQAKERLEHVAEGRKTRKSTRRTAVIIAVMAAVLALTEFAEKDAQANFLSGQITVSNIWAQYQAKSVRRVVLSAEADLLEELPGGSSPAAQKKIAAARANAARMRSEPGADGMEQLMARARAQEHLRDHEERRKTVLETASGGLQIAIVLASISVVVEMPGFMLASVLLGLASTIYALVGAFTPR